MKANAISLLGIFEKKMRLEVPLFQRQYVWSLGQQWQPLWEDIERKFTEYLDGRKDAPVHFLGAMVLDQKFTPTAHVEKRQIIDGQQRLTTLQIFLAAFRDFCQEQACDELAKECESYTSNRGMMADPNVDKFKVWPTRSDQAQFIDVISSGSRVELETRHPLIRRKYARTYNPRPRMVEAYLFFHDQISGFFLGTNGEKPLAAQFSLAERLEECFQALKNALQVVAIDLEQDDDAQVIFETLNARGEPLLPADLLRNYIFLRAARHEEPQEELYEKYWQRFDEPFWRVTIKQGRLLRPRSDLFIQHFLASRQTVDIPIKHLFVEYKFWIEKKQPFATVRDELAELSKQGDDFRRIVDPQKGEPTYDLATFLNIFDIRTVHPLLLMLFDEQIEESQWQKISVALESYLLRRAVCGLTTKNYNRIFLSLTRNLRRDGATPENLIKQLSEQTGETVEWPSDEAFREAWRVQHIYQTLNNPKIVHILKRLSASYFKSKMETLSIEGPLTVEHILPQGWLNHWPLPDGSTGMNNNELWEATENDPRAEATRKRNAAVQTLGNLTILTQPLNSAASNNSWEVKKPELLLHSLLPINQNLQNVEVWDETAIQKRGEELFQRALQLWPR
jgi:uncharacterized protein with ParB-like and HNH nuclease domain